MHAHNLLGIPRNAPKLQTVILPSTSQLVRARWHDQRDDLCGHCNRCHNRPADTPPHVAVVVIGQHISQALNFFLGSEVLLSVHAKRVSLAYHLRARQERWQKCIVPGEEWSKKTKKKARVLATYRQKASVAGGAERRRDR